MLLTLNELSKSKNNQEIKIQATNIQEEKFHNQFKLPIVALLTDFTSTHKGL